MRASKLQSIWIITRSIIIFMVYPAGLLVSFCFVYDRYKRRAIIDKHKVLWSELLLKEIKLKLSLHNKENLNIEEGRKYMFMCNHCSLYDIPVLMSTMPGSFRLLAKKELYKIPIWGWLLKLAEFPPIDRKNKTRALQNLENVKELMSTGIEPCIFVEGTRSKDGKLQPLKKGGFHVAIQTNAIIIPLILNGTHKILPKKSLKFSINQHVDICVGTQIDCKNYSPETREQLMQNVEEQMFAMLAPDQKP